MDKFYDMIAKDYDQLIQEDVKNKKFPYAAYNEMQDLILTTILSNQNQSRVKILDLGIGTGAFYEKIFPEKLKLTGVDNSKKMLEISKLRFPDANLYQYDLSMGLPEEVKEEKYDYIIINFFIKHFDYHYVVDLINLLSRQLAQFGKIFIGDILFCDPQIKNLYLENHPENLNPAYYYHTFSEIVRKTDESLAVSFMELNAYSGVLIIEKYYESSLHFEDSLIKYKSNTEKWKSTQKQKKRE